MRILIDLQSCQSGSRLGGIGRYSLALAKAMVSQGRSHEFLILLNRQLPAENEIREQFRTLLPQHRILAFDVPSGVAEVHDNVAKTRLAELVREQFIASLQPDVVHISSLIEGLGDDVVTSVGRIYPACRTAVTLYDLIPLVEREKYLTNHVLENHYLRKIAYLRQAGILLAISDYSRQEAIEVGGITPDHVTNISSAIDHSRFHPVQVSPTRKRSLCERYGIDRDYLMFTSSFDVRKNHRRLIQAFSMLPERTRSRYQLVLVGNGTSWIYSSLLSCAKEYGLTEDCLVFPGHVPDSDLIDLYNLCSLFVFPSLREGFGLPVLEAMSCGVPTIGANTTSVPEVLGRVDASFDPSDPQAISDAMYRALSDAQFRTDLAKHALKHSQSFSWDVSAQKALDFIELSMTNVPTAVAVPSERLPVGNAAGSESYGRLLAELPLIPGANCLADDCLRETACSIAANRYVTGDVETTSAQWLHVGWITSWNCRCGIASYSQNLVQEAGLKATIFAPLGQPRCDADGSNVVRCWSFGDKDLSQLMLALDEARVDLLSIQMNYGFFDFPTLSDFIAKQKRCGRMVSVTLHSTVDPPRELLDRRLVDLAPALRECDLILVHSLSDVNNLAAIGVCKNVSLFPQGVVTPPEGDAEYRPGRQVIRIGTYGFFLPHKGLDKIILAIYELRNRGVLVELEMVNAKYSDEASSEAITRCSRLVEELALQEFVSMRLDYLEDAESLQYLAKMDLVVFPYQDTDESSSAAVRMALAAGVPVAVTPLRIFDDVRDVVLTLPGSSHKEIAQGIESAIEMIRADSSSLRSVLARSRRWVDCHRFSELGSYFRSLVRCARAKRTGESIEVRSFGTRQIKSQQISGSEAMDKLDRDYRLFVSRCRDVLDKHGLANGSDGAVKLSQRALDLAATGNWDTAAVELRDALQSALGQSLTEVHAFSERPYVRRIDFPEGGGIGVGIINRQSEEWYGTEYTIGSFDFLEEATKGAFEGCKTFLDLGGHQMIWACYYAMLNDRVQVTTVEPSILNVIIGLFNCLINGVIDRVNVVPFAVATSAASPGGSDEASKMLVDFMAIPVRTVPLASIVSQPFDFVKVDVEGYEYDLLSDPVFVGLVMRAMNTHFELHLGHLEGRGIHRSDCVSRLRAAGVRGRELHSGQEMFEFLAGCDPRGFFAFLLAGD